MRLKEAQIKLICQKIFQSLRQNHLIQSVKSETEVLAKMEHLFMAELKIEDNIDREVEQMLAQMASKMGPNIDRQKMFDMIKKQLLKDRKVVM
jgi:hypothetical protein